MSNKNKPRYSEMQRQYQQHLMASRRTPDPSHRAPAFVVLMFISSVLSFAGFVWFAMTYWA